MTAYYNEHDPFAAVWLRELIKDGLIAPGDVDERSIEDVTPNDVATYTQCHFFAGIGGWSYALRLAGWPDDRPVWTGSPPCQPFSSAGKGGGFADERHLWPAFFWLIRYGRPDTIFGEQVSSKAGLAWWDVVATDLEAAGYGVGAFDLCAAGAGAFHLRQRLYFVADANCKRGHNWRGAGKGCVTGSQKEWRQGGEVTEELCASGSMANADGSKRRAEAIAGSDHERQTAERDESSNSVRECGGFSGVAHAIGSQEHQEQQRPAENEGERSPNSLGGRSLDFWSDAQWLICRDGKARAVEPSIFPLAHGVPNRVGTLRGAGNAIVPEVAAEFIGAYLEILND